MRAAIANLIIVLAYVGVAGAQHWNTTLVGTWTQPGFNAARIFVDGDRAYLIEGAGTVIVDVSEPATPQYLASIAALEVPVITVAAGDLAVLLEDIRSIRLFDVADPAAPVGLSVITSVEEPQAAVLAGEFLYVGDGNQLVHVYDLGDPTAPVLAGWFVTPDEVRELVLVGDLLYAACYHGGLRIYDVSDPAMISEVGFAPSGSRSHVAVAGDLAATQDALGLNRFLDVSDPAIPVPLGDMLYVAVAEGIHLDPPFAYVGHNVLGVRILDLSDPAAPVEVGYDEPSTYLTDFVMHGDLIYEAVASHGLRIVRHDRLTGSPPPALTGTRLLDPVPNPFNPAVRIAFTCDQPRRVTVRIHGLAGRLVAEVAAGDFAAGDHAVTWTGRDHHGRTVASGTYRVVLEGDGVRDSRTVTMVK